MPSNMNNDNHHAATNVGRHAAPRWGRTSWRKNSKRNKLNGTRFSVEALEPRQLLSGNPVLTEFMADNDENLGLAEDLVYKVAPTRNDPGVAKYPFREGKTPDWVEVFNDGDEAVDLKGYFLTDDLDNLKQWEFPKPPVF